MPESIEGENRETTIINWKKELSTYDLLEVGECLVLLQKEKERIENEKSKQAAKFSSLLKQIEADRIRKTRMLEEKVEHVEEECSFEMDYDNGVVHYISVSNGSIVKSRGMSNEERQMKLFDDQALSHDIPSYEESPMNDIDASSSEDGESEYDEKYDEALEIVDKAGRASISMLQRRLGVGYNRAARMVEMMERNGVVKTSSSEEPPRCHMKPMVIITDEEGGEIYSCEKCGSTKPVE